MADLRLTKPPMKGPAVRKLQTRLAALGFDPGEVDGEFGPDTDAAVRAFQESSGLEVDGVAGADTQKALGGGRSKAKKPAADDTSTAAGATGPLTPDQIAAVLGCTVKAVRANWPPILEALGAQGIDDLPS